MKAYVNVNRQIVARNVRHGTDDPAISIRTYRETVYVRRVELGPGVVLRQDFAHPLSCGARVFVEVDDVGRLAWEPPA